MTTAPITVGPAQTVDLATFHQLVAGAPLTFTDEVWTGIEASRALLERLVAERRLIYGVTTGYGPLAAHYIDPSRSAELQRNLVYHLASGFGPPLTREQIKKGWHS